jgi:hypothetical protein
MYATKINKLLVATALAGAALGVTPLAQAGDGTPQKRPHIIAVKRPHIIGVLKREHIIGVLKREHIIGVLKRADLIGVRKTGGGS